MRRVIEMFVRKVKKDKFKKWGLCIAQVFFHRELMKSFLKEGVA